jgi:zinc-binding alcohol dehydrogenase family protein
MAAVDRVAARLGRSWAGLCAVTKPRRAGGQTRAGHRRGPRRRPGDLHNPARPARSTGAGHHRRIVRAHGGRERLEALSHLVDAGTLRPQVEAVLPLDEARQALTRVAGRHTRGKIVLQIGQ